MNTIPSKKEFEVAAKWLLGDDVGFSGISICRHMLCGDADYAGYGYADWPIGPSDIGRCFRLIEKIPQWEKRIPEMAKYNPAWNGLSSRWLEIKKCMDEEVGLDWSKGEKAPKTYKLMLLAVADGD